MPPMPSLPTSIDARAAHGQTGSPPDMAAMMQSSDFAAKASRAGVLDIEPNAPFFLRHHPNAWRVSTTLDKPMVLPDVTMMIISPGVNGCRTVGKNEQPDMAYRQAIMNAQLKHWTYLDPMAPIPANCLPDGVPAGSYIREIACQGIVSRRTGKYYLEAWSVPIATLPDQAQRFKFDTAKYELWLKFLVESGQVAPMIEGIKETMVERVRAHVERAEGLNLNPDVRKKWLARKEKILAAYQSAEVGQELTGKNLEKALKGYGVS